MRTISNNLRLNKEQFSLLKYYSKEANSLYNCALWTCKEYYKSTGTYIGLSSLDKEMQKNEHYKNMISYNAQAIIRLVDKNYRIFFALLKRKLSGTYQQTLHEPSYRRKNDYYLLIFNNTRFNIKKGKLKLFKNLKISFSYEIKNLKQATIKWNGKNFQIFINYEEVSKPELPDNKNYLSIDLGLNNLATCVSNVGQSFIINGKPLKSYNQFYNKQVSKIKSELKLKNNKYYSKRLQFITEKRRRFVNNYLNQSIAFIVKHCISNEINTIILGYNESWKQEINLGSKTNQQFSDIPFYKFREKLFSRCEKEGIRFILTEESYTSKTSFIDNELPKKLENYLGKRIKRGLFKSSTGKLYNADCNGAAQIMCKKVILNLESRNKIGAFIVSPRIINII